MTASSGWSVGGTIRPRQGAIQAAVGGVGGDSPSTPSMAAAVSTAVLDHTAGRAAPHDAQEHGDGGNGQRKLRSDVLKIQWTL